MELLSIINFIFVLFFGVSLSLSFADIPIKRNIKEYTLTFLGLGTIQLLAYFIVGKDLLFKSYPLLTHLPLFLLLKLYYKKNTYIAGIAVLSAYLFCTPRKWVGTALSYFWGYDPGVSYLVQILVTLPLLWLIIKYISPCVARLNFESAKILRFFIIVPLIYYVLEYTFTVYTDLLYQGVAVIVEFMDAAVVVVYFIFSVIYLKTLYEKKQVEVDQAMLKILADQSHSEIEKLRKAEKQAAIHRHDLKRHMNYLYTCLSEQNYERALTYIDDVCREIDNTKVVRYSENESVNLILTSYVAKAAEKKIHSEIKVSTVDFGKFTELDLCNLLASALENAISACEHVSSDKRLIKLRMYSKNNKLCLDIRNSYSTESLFHQGLPISKEQVSSFDTKSMILLVEKYGGICQFSVKDGLIIFQATA